MAQVTENWWQWAVNLDRNDGNNPFESADGAFAAAGYMPNSHMFYLAGIAGSTFTPEIGRIEVTRNIEVPSNVSILVPVINTVETIPDYKASFPDGVATIDNVKKYLFDWKNSYVQEKFLFVDGKQIPLENSYVESGPFSLGTLEEGELGYIPFGLRPDKVEQEPAFAAGYWGVINGFGVTNLNPNYPDAGPPGTHTIVFGGSIDYTYSSAGYGPPDGVIDFSYMVTDHITIVPPSQYHPNMAPASTGFLFG